MIVTGCWYLADYDAVLTEAGDYTAKYIKLREFFGSISGAWQAADSGTNWGPCFGPQTPSQVASMLPTSAVADVCARTSRQGQAGLGD